MSFYNNRKQIKADFPDLEVTFLVKIWMIITTLLIIFCITNSIPLFCQQIYYVFNDTTYHEFMKNPFLESNWGIIKSRNEDKSYNPNNKGFLFNFYHIIGPSVLHLILPIPKYNESYDILENKECFQNIQSPHTFQIHNFMKNNEFPDFDDHWREQLMAMDPDLFIQLSKVNYEGKMII